MSWPPPRSHWNSALAVTGSPPSPPVLRTVIAAFANWITVGPGRSQWLLCFTSPLPVVKSNVNKGLIFVATLLATLHIHQEDCCLFLHFIYSLKKYRLYFVLGARDTAVDTTEEAAPALREAYVSSGEDE